MLEFSKLFPRVKLQNGGAARASHAFPVSMTTFRPWVSKVLEKHVFTDNHCNKVISERVIPLTRIVNHKVLPALNNEYEVGSIYLDFSKDFDKVYLTIYCYINCRNTESVVPLAIGLQTT